MYVTIQVHVRQRSAVCFVKKTAARKCCFNVLIGILIICPTNPLSLEAINKHVVSERILEIARLHPFVLITCRHHIFNSGK